MNICQLNTVFIVPIRCFIWSVIASMLRFVIRSATRGSPYAEVDLDNRLAGKGVYTVSSREAVQEAVKTRAFALTCRLKDVQMDEKLPNIIHDQLRSRCLNKLRKLHQDGKVVINPSMEECWGKQTTNQTPFRIVLSTIDSPNT